jgi:putative acetyltransferase
MKIIEDDATGEAIQGLLRRHAEGMLANSPEGSCHFLDVSGFQRPDVTLWSIWDGDALAGCGALRELDPTHGEVKSMRTADEHLGKGVGGRVLEHVIAVARARNYGRLSLETGSTDAFAAAIHLYERAGFEECDPFGDYEASEFNRFFTLELS